MLSLVAPSLLPLVAVPLLDLVAPLLGLVRAQG